jgi:hypothetical protein
MDCGENPKKKNSVAFIPQANYTDRATWTQDANCTDVDGGIFENVLYQENCTNYVESTVLVRSAKLRNIAHN